MIRSTLACVTICVAVLAGGCDRGARATGVVETAKAGVAEKVSENTYRNSQFGLTVTAPDGWFVSDNELTKNMMDLSKDVMTADQDAKTKALVERSMDRAVNIFAFFRHPLGAPVDSNPSVIAVAENVSFLPGIERGKDYFFHTRNMLEQTNIQHEVLGDYKARKIGGQMFDRMDLRLTMAGAAVLQRIYAARHDGWVMAIVQSYQSDEELIALDTVLDSIRLDW